MSQQQPFRMLRQAGRRLERKKKACAQVAFVVPGQPAARRGTEVAKSSRLVRLGVWRKC